MLRAMFIIRVQLIRLGLIVAVSGVSWEEWWTYDGISGEWRIFIIHYIVNA